MLRAKNKWSRSFWHEPELIDYAKKHLMIGTPQAAAPLIGQRVHGPLLLIGPAQSTGCHGGVGHEQLRRGIRHRPYRAPKVPQGALPSNAGTLAALPFRGS